MITVYLAYSVTDAQEVRIRKLIEREQLRNVDFNGAEFSFERDDSTWLDADHYPDQGAVNRLYSDINNILHDKS